MEFPLAHKDPSSAAGTQQGQRSLIFVTGMDDWVSSDDQTFFHGLKLAVSDIKMWILMIMITGKVFSHHKKGRPPFGRALTNDC